MRVRFPWVPGVVVAGVATATAFLLHLLFPVVPLLTASVGLGILAGQLPTVRRWIDGVLKAGLTFSAKRLMRVGIVLLGLKLSLVDIVHLGWVAIVLTVLIVLLTFTITWGLGKLFRLPDDEPVLLATGFSICGASAIGAMSAVTRTTHEDQATPVALVTLFGTLAIGVLPLLRGPLGLNAHEFGQWVGASVHDVGQVVATAQTAGAAALAIAVVVKLTRVLMLVPMVAAASVVVRRTRSAVEYCVLGLLAREPMYGWQLSETLTARGLIASIGTLYPMLSRLRNQGLVSTFDEASDAGPVRKYYRLTDAGTRELATFRQQWAPFVSTVEDFIREESHDD